MRWLSPWQFKAFSRSVAVLNLDRYRDAVRAARSLKLNSEDGLMAEIDALQRLLLTKGSITPEITQNARIEARYGPIRTDVTDRELSSMGIEVISNTENSSEE